MTTDPHEPLRCLVTGNPCGTDTWNLKRPCKCDHCQEWLCEMIFKGSSEVARLQADRELLTLEQRRHLERWLDAHVLPDASAPSAKNIRLTIEAIRAVLDDRDRLAAELASAQEALGEAIADCRTNGDEASAKRNLRWGVFLDGQLVAGFITQRSADICRRADRDSGFAGRTGHRDGGA